MNEDNVFKIKWKPENPSNVVYRKESRLKNGNGVVLVRFESGKWGLGFVALEGNISVVSRAIISDEAMSALADSYNELYNELKDKPIPMRFNVVVETKKRKKAKKK